MTQTIREFLLKGEKEERFLISDVATHGCSGGTISELIYYDDTAKFHDKHEDEIWDELITMSEEFHDWLDQCPVQWFRGEVSKDNVTYIFETPEEEENE